MKETKVSPSSRYGFDFVPREFLPPGATEYYKRDEQSAAARKAWRPLRAAELEILVKNDNSCSDWNHFRVADPFDPSLIKNSSFFGLIRIGRLEDVVLQHHDFRLHAGIRNSTIISCDIGDNCAIQDCSYISHYLIGDTVMLSRVDELQTTNHAKFGAGGVKDGEDEEVRVWIDVMNEAGGRSILAFPGMICADAYLWAAYRDDEKLLRSLKAITQRQVGSARGAYGTIGSCSVIKSTGIVKDVAVGECAYIKGANKLKNLTIESSEDEPTQIGEGVELVNGIVGYGCRIFYGSKAVRFVMGRNCGLKYGARLIHSVLGDNSTVSCCEMLNNLIFPGHEQHHNNSFLIASLVQGLSNMAAGATVGSNHNSRANDGEIRAGRGFWPGLCVTLKHSSRFASFVLIAKGDYPYELNVTLPFCLVNNDVHRDRLELMPAYFWMYNLYALERNAWKIATRDKRVAKVQKIEADYLAPDTAEEIVTALTLLERWTATARLGADGDNPASLTEADLAKLGKTLLLDREDRVSELEVLAEGVERRSRKTVVLKVRRAYRAYRRMLRWYAIRGVIAYAKSHPLSSLKEIAAELAGQRRTAWENLGGQIVPSFRVEDLRSRIGEGALASWEDIHSAYAEFDREYPLDVARHAWACLTEFFAPPGGVTTEFFLEELRSAEETRRFITDQVRSSRGKDYTDSFRKITFRNAAEMEAVVGSLEDNPFIRISAEERDRFIAEVKALIARFTPRGR